MITPVHKMIRLLNDYFNDEVPDARIDGYMLACGRQRQYQRERHMPVLETGKLSQKRHPPNEQKDIFSARLLEEIWDVLLFPGILLLPPGVRLPDSSSPHTCFFLAVCSNTRLHH